MHISKWLLPCVCVTLLFFTMQLKAQKPQAQPTGKLAEFHQLFAAQDYDAAEDVIKDVLDDDKHSVEALMLYGTLKMAREKWEDATDKFEDVLKLEPDNYEAHYYRGICFREEGRYKARFMQSIPLVKRLLEWHKSEREFNWIMERDSLYKDVIYQLAKLESYKTHHHKAINLGHLQIAKKPDLVDATIGLHRFYRYFLNQQNNSDAESWLQTNNQREQALFFLAEYKRRNNDFSASLLLLQELFDQKPQMSHVPLLFSIAQSKQQLNFLESAQHFFTRAVDAIKTDIDAAFMFERVKYILTEPELQVYENFTNPAEKKAFFREMWIKRDPMPAAAINARAMEHLRRYSHAEQNFEYFGVRSQVNNPDKLRRLSYPLPYQLNDEFNDKGFIYIRHGAPDDRVITLNEHVIPNESWRYFASSEFPEMTFHFLVDESATSDNWRLAPLLPDTTMLQDRVNWGTQYHRMLTADPIEQLAIESEMSNTINTSVKQAFTSDRHTWSEAVKPLHFYYSIASFRGHNDSTEVDIYFSIPLIEIIQAADSLDKVVLNQGFSLYDSNWREIKKDLKYAELLMQNKRIHPNTMIINTFKTQVTPGEYHVSLHANPEKTGLLAGYKFDETFDDYKSNGLTMSDILLAYDVRPAQDAKFTKGEIDVVVNPSARFAKENPFYSFVELYNLQKDEASGTSRYLVKHTLKLIKSNKSKIKRFFSFLTGGDKSSITITSEHESEMEVVQEYIALDASAVQAGQYELTIEIQDLNSTETISKTAIIYLL